MKSREDFKSQTEYQFYLAVHYAGQAPEVPDWFIHNFQEDKPRPPANYISISDDGTPVGEYIRNYCNDEDYFFRREPVSLDEDKIRIMKAAHARIDKFQQDWDDFFIKEKDYNYRNKQARYFQWRVYYAQTLATVMVDLDVTAIKQFYPNVFKDGK